MSDFKNAAEIQRYLLKDEKKRVYTKMAQGDHYVLGYKEGVLYNFTLNEPSSIGFVNPHLWSKHKEGWINSIPERGILCKIPYRDSPVVISYYDEDDEDYPFQSDDDTFAEATPLTDLEIIEYLSNKDLIAHIKNHLNNRKTR